MLGHRRIASFALLSLAVLAGRLSAAEPEENNAPLAMKDLSRMRQKRVPLDQMVDKATERGISFEVTPAIQNQLRRMGFKPDQIEAIKASAGPRDKAAGDEKAESAGPIVPGQELRTTDAQRDASLEYVKQVTKASGAGVQPAAARHVTLWTAKNDQAAFLADVKKLEKTFETRCKEPIRSGLDKRSAHLVIIPRHYEYEKWINAMIEAAPERFQRKDEPGVFEEWKARTLKGPGLYCSDFCVFCTEGITADYAHRMAASSVGYMYFMQLAECRRTDPLVTGFANVAETIVAGTPSVLIFGHGYHENRNLAADPRAWIHLVQRRMITKEASEAAQLVQMDASRDMLFPHYAEAWTLVGLLAKQPDKFGELVTTLRSEQSALKAIQDVYGWDEKQLSLEWRKHVMGQK